MSPLPNPPVAKSHAKKAKRKILVIEDDADLAEVLEYNFVREGYDVECRRDGLEGWEAVRRFEPDLVVLDLMLPSLRGEDICRQIRTDPATKAAAVIMLTAKSEETDQLIGFSVGADDYVIKPFSVKVLLERVRVLLDRREPREPSAALQGHGIALDPIGHSVLCDGEPVALTPTEFRLLQTLMSHPGRAYSRSSLLDSAIGDDTIVLERTIDVHIRALRQKLKRSGRAIETVRGVGYRFARELDTGDWNPNP